MKILMLKMHIMLSNTLISMKYEWKNNGLKLMCWLWQGILNMSN